MYDFGMKMYTSQPIRAQLFLQEELWLDESCTFSCRNRTRSGISTVSKSAVKNPYRSKHCLLLKRQISSQVQVFLWLSDKAAFVQLTKVKWIALSESCYNWGTDFALLIQIILDSGGKAGTHLRLIAPIFHLSPLSMKGHDTIWESRSRDKLCFIITSLNKYHEMYTKW